MLTCDDHYEKYTDIWAAMLILRIFIPLRLIGDLLKTWLRNDNLLN